MAQYKFSIVGTTAEPNLFKNIRNVSIANAFRNIGNHFQGVAVGAISEAVTINSGPTFGTGAITITVGNLSADETITIAGVVLTAKASPTGLVQFKVGATALQTGISLAAVINANPTLTKLVTASYAKSSTSAIITVTAKAAGTAGNLTWSESASNTTILPASALAGGADGPISATATITSTGSAVNDETMLLCNQTLTAKTSGAVAASGEFNISGTVATQATNIAAAINAVAALSGVVTATSSLGVVTVTAVNPGIGGNGLQISESLTNVTIAAFSGGVNANVVTLHKGI